MAVTRRRWIALGAGILAAPVIDNNHLLLGSTQPAYSFRTLELIRTSVVVDMLGLLTLDYKKLCAWQQDPATFPASEFTRLRNSGVTVIHPAVGFMHSDAYDSSSADFARWNYFLAAHPDKFVKVTRPADVARAKQTGKIGVVLGLQNSQHFRTLADVDRFYALGQRVSQLTYINNRLGGGSADQGFGLTTYGADVIQRMNQLGMAVDLSHCGDRTTLDAIDASSKPSLVTHSNCRALVPGSLRCKSDEAIRRLAAKGGVFGVTMVRQFVRAAGPTTLENMLDHIDHIVRLTGVEHAGLGTDVDLDGRDTAQPFRFDLDGEQYSQKIFDVTEGLLRRGYSSTDVALILGGNFQRILAQIWAA